MKFMLKKAKYINYKFFIYLNPFAFVTPTNNTPVTDRYCSLLL